MILKHRIGNVCCSGLIGLNSTTWLANAGASLGRGFVQVVDIKKPCGAGVWFVVTGGSGSSHVGKFRVTFGTKG